MIPLLRRLKDSSDVEIDTESAYIKSGIDRIPEYERSQWITSRGERVKYTDLWMEVAAILKRQASVTTVLSRENEWASWMEAEAKRKIQKKCKS